VALGEAQSVQRPGAGGTVLDGTVDLARDRHLVERCQDGDRTAFEELYHRYHRRLFHFCLRRLHEPYEAEDAVQEAFTRAWRALPDFAGDRRFYPWLTVIAGNICTDTLRRSARLTPVEEVPLPTIDLGSRDVDEHLIEQVDAAMAAQALEHLSDRHQRVLQLREGSGWSTQRLADHEGVAVPVMETLLWRARQALKREFAALTETGGRLGTALILGVAALRRFAGRTTSRVASLPLFQSTSMRGPGALVASLVLAGGVVSGAVLVVAPHPSPPAAVSMPPASQTAASQTPDQTTLPAALPAAAGTAGPGTIKTAGSTAGFGARSTADPRQAASPGPAPTGSGNSSAGDSGGTALPAGVGTLPIPSSGAGGGLGPVTSGVGSAVTGVGNAAGAVGSTVGSAATNAAGAVGSTASSVVNQLGGVLGGLTGPGTGHRATSDNNSSGGGLLGTKP
jgi:RNA polymerase sigma-70 factor, ECF subfamily